jgi:hypothetical protein
MARGGRLLEELESRSRGGHGQGYWSVVWAVSRQGGTKAPCPKNSCKGFVTVVPYERSCADDVNRGGAAGGFLVLRIRLHSVRHGCRWYAGRLENSRV